MSGSTESSVACAFCVACVDCAESVTISLAASLLRSANLRTSAATTENPRPCSPARAASTAAFSAKMFVWFAISLITRIFSLIVSTDSSEARDSPPSSCKRLPKSFDSSCELLARSALLSMFADISSMALLTSSALAACVFAPCESPCELAFSCSLANATSSAPLRITESVSCIRIMSISTARAISPNSSP